MHRKSVHNLRSVGRISDRPDTYGAVRDAIDRHVPEAPEPLDAYAAEVRGVERIIANGDFGEEEDRKRWVMLQIGEGSPIKVEAIHYRNRYHHYVEFYPVGFKLCKNGSVHYTTKDVDGRIIIMEAWDYEPIHYAERRVPVTLRTLEGQVIFRGVLIEKRKTRSDWEYIPKHHEEEDAPD